MAAAQCQRLGLPACSLRSCARCTFFTAIPGHLPHPLHLPTPSPFTPHLHPTTPHAPHPIIPPSSGGGSRPDRAAAVRGLTAPSPSPLHPTHPILTPLPPHPPTPTPSGGGGRPERAAAVRGLHAGGAAAQRDAVRGRQRGGPARRHAAGAALCAHAGRAVQVGGGFWWVGEGEGAGGRGQGWTQTRCTARKSGSHAHSPAGQCCSWFSVAVYFWPLPCSSRAQTGLDTSQNRVGRLATHPWRMSASSPKFWRRLPSLPHRLKLDWKLPKGRAPEQHHLFPHVPLGAGQLQPPVSVGGPPPRLCTPARPRC